MHRAKGGAKPSLLLPGPVLILLLQIPKSSSNIAEPPLKTVHLAKCPLWAIVEPMTAPKGLKFCWGSSVQPLSHVRLFATPWTAAFPVHHQLPELAQTHVHRVSDAIQPPRPQSSHYPAFNLSQHQGRFQWVSSSHQMAKVLELQL